MSVAKRAGEICAIPPISRYDSTLRTAGVIAAFDHAIQAHVAALAALGQWLAQYLKIAKIALRAKPDLIEKLGGLADLFNLPGRQ